MDRKPNELLISRELLEAFFVVGYDRPAYRVKQGPGPDAHIVGVRIEQDYNLIVLEYDRPIDEPILVNGEKAA